MPHKDPGARRAYRHAYQQRKRAEIASHKRRYAEATREHRLERARQYRAANKETIAAANKRYREIHREAIRLQHQAAIKKYQKRHRDQLREASRRYEKTKRAESRQRYRAAHLQELRMRDQVKAASRRARLRQASSNDLTVAQWQAIKEHYDHRCVYCDRRMQSLTQDHIVPLSKGGNHTFTNIIPACRSCNSKKRTGPPLRPVQPLLLLVEGGH